MITTSRLTAQPDLRDPVSLFPNFNKRPVRGIRATLFFLFALFALPLFSQNTWNGAVSTDWATGGNWSLGAQPTAAEDVIIADVANDPTIGTAALAKSVVVNTGAVLTVAAAGSLTIDGNVSFLGFFVGLGNAGTVQNNGIIRIGATSSSGDHGIRNQSIFNNNTGGQITIDRSVTAAIFNRNGTFTNRAAITIGATVSTGLYGIFNEATFDNLTGGQITVDRSTDVGVLNFVGGTFNNSAAITIGANAAFGLNGIRNEALFNNNTGGQIRIDQTSSSAVDNVSGTFNNVAAITIGANASVGSYGISNLAMFNNNNGGQIAIDRTGASALRNGGGTFNNAAGITIGAIAGTSTVGVLNEATFNNTTGGQIKVDNYDIGVANQTGTFTNAANITVGAIDIGGYGIRNLATFHNNTGSQITIDRSDTDGLFNETGTFNNAATITVGGNADIGFDGIHNNAIFNNNTGGQIQLNRSTFSGIFIQSGTFNNAATITIGNIAGTIPGAVGLRNHAAFNNNTGGQITIDRPTDAGIFNPTGTFTNAAAITIGANAAVGNDGIHNEAIFSNNPGGQIQLNRSINSGLVNQFGTFTNAATITIGNIAGTSPGASGLRNYAAFNNNTGGQITIDRSTSSGLLNATGGTLINAQTITIGANASVGTLGIENTGTVNNNVCAQIFMFAPLNNSSSFTNAGLFWVNTASAHTNSALTNNGIIDYPMGNPIPNVTNNEIIALPIAGMSPVSPALSLGAPVDFIIAANWFLDQALTMPAGTFNLGTNAFTNTNVPFGVPTTVYFSINDVANDCSQTVSILATIACTPPAAPTGSSPQVFCSATNPTIASLVVVGSNIIWYDMASGGSVLPTSTPLVNGTIYHASQTVTGCESTARLAVTATVNPTPAAPTGSSPQVFCSATNPTIASLVVVGSNIIWYDMASGGSVLPTSTPLVNGTIYHASQTVTGCESTARLAVTATVTASPAAPTGSSPQVFCSATNPTIASLVVVGSNIIWYNMASGGSVLPTSTPLVNGTIYHASQTVGGCESTARLAVTASVVPNPAPPSGSPTQILCAGNNPTVADLLIPGTGVQWYAAATGGSPLPLATPLVSGSTYFAGQTIFGCESLTRFGVTVTINPTPPAPTGATPQLFCAGPSAVVANLTATGTAIQWYAAATGGFPLLPTHILINGSHYFASQTVNGCESTARLDVTATVSSNTPPPTAATPQTFCSGANPTIASLSATGTDIKWYIFGNGGSPLPASTPLVDGAGYYCTQTLSGCESMPRVFVAVFVKNTPPAPVGPSPQGFCTGANPTVGGLSCAGTGILWYNSASGGSLLPNSTPLVSGMHYFATQTVNGCESTARLDVTALVSSNPSAPTGASPQVFCTGDNPNVASFAVTGTGISWYSAASGGAALPPTTPLVNGTQYFASQTVTGCESALRLAVTATVNNSPAPPTGFCFQIFCLGDSPTIASLVANGTGLQWFATPTGGSPLPPNTPLANGATYYCSQTVAGCPSATRLPVMVTVKTPAIGAVCLPGCGN